MSTSPYYNKIQVDVKVDDLEQQIANVADGTAGKAYPNLTTAMSVDPLPEDGVIFTIDEDNETEAGVYAYDSNEVNGYRFVREFSFAKGKVEEGNTQAVSGGEVFEQFFKEKSYNLANKETIKLNTRLNTSGEISANANHSTIYKAPVIPGDIYYREQFTADSVYFYDKDGLFKNSSWTASAYISIPDDVYFISYSVVNSNVNLSLLFLTKVKYNGEKPIYIKGDLPLNTSYFVTKRELNDIDGLVEPPYLNQNSNWKVFSRFGIPEVTSLHPQFQRTIISNNIPFFQRYGFVDLIKFTNTSTSYAPQVGFNFSGNFRNKYIYISAFFYTNNLDFNFTLGNNPIVYNGNNPATLLKSNITQVAEGISRIDCVARIPDVDTTNITARIIHNQGIIAEDKDYIFTPASYAITDKFYNVDTLYSDLDFSTEHKNNAELISLRNKFPEYILDKILYKKWELYGTSIEASNYIDEVANVYNAKLVNNSMSGSVICYAPDVWSNATRETAIKRCWSITKSEKIAALNSYGYTPATEAELNLSYDVSLLENLDSDLFMIGTYGINDRNAQLIAINPSDEFDRGTIYGAYNYVLRALYQAKPSAKVIIFGQHTFAGWGLMKEVNEIQKMVAEKWGIPFLNWGYKLGINSETIPIYAPDGAHLSASGKTLVSDFLTQELYKHMY